MRWFPLLSRTRESGQAFTLTVTEHRKANVSKPNAAKKSSAESVVLARRYAKALFELADGQSRLDAVSADMLAIRKLLGDCAEFRRLTVSPLVTCEQAAQGVRSIAEIGKLSALTGQFLAVLAANRRLYILDGIICAFLSDMAVRRGEVTANVIAARALSAEQRDRLSGNLAKLAGGGKIILNVREDADLLGGIVVQIGSCRIDASLSGKLTRMERQLQKSQEMQTEAA